MTGLPRLDKLPANTPLFTVPSGLIRILDRDLTLAGIPKRDERGRTIDVHSMRTSFCSLLSKAGIAPRTAMAAARHSDLSLTMGAYTDPALLDVAGALDALPALPLDGAGDDRQEQRARTGKHQRSLMQRLHQMLAILVQPWPLLTIRQASGVSMAGGRRLP